MHIVKEEPAMPRTTSFKKGNYSHCPLKKRPVHVFIKEESSNDAIDESPEPENLSTKPEDLTCKSLTPPIGVALISCKKEEDPLAERPEEQPLGHDHFEATGGHFMGKAAGPLEPLNLNTQQELAWPKPYYPPPHYLPLNYSYPPPQFYHYYGDKYQAAPAVASPPHQSYVPSLPQPRPIYVPATYSTATAPPECGLSPTSSTSSLSHGVYSYPPSTPEDLSSPGSVVSSGGCSPSRKRKDVSPRYKCNFCSKSYSTYSGLSKHQQFHCSANEDSSSAKKTFSCKDCDKVYVSLGALKMHIRTHTLPCKCKLCGKAFSRPWLLQGHIRTHTGEKPFTCPHCNRAFADRSNLRAHLQTHSDVKKYSCPSCSKTFSRMSLLTKHTDGGCPGIHPNPNGTVSDDGLYHHHHHHHNQDVYSS